MMRRCSSWNGSLHAMSPKEKTKLVHVLTRMQSDTDTRTGNLVLNEKLDNLYGDKKRMMGVADFDDPGDCDSDCSFHHLSLVSPSSSSRHGRLRPSQSSLILHLEHSLSQRDCMSWTKLERCKSMADVSTCCSTACLEDSIASLKVLQTGDFVTSTLRTFARSKPPQRKHRLFGRRRDQYRTQEPSQAVIQSFLQPVSFGVKSLPREEELSFVSLWKER
jgi:hypothetical protein